MAARRASVLATMVAIALSLGIASAAAAAPNPDNNKNAFWLDMECGGHAVTIAGIVQNNAASVQVVDGSGVTMHMTSLWSWSDAGHSQDETLWFDVPGFTHNDHGTITCDFTNPRYPGLYWEAEMFVSPAG